ncbi:hypothetical protein BGW36DRAFT_358965 [Talaromyces proteolyticus]|uniref:Galactose oxidase n=1 Tax=Talaromyces proteolyticus TaxID=1131652 RepID=A0AAD4KQK5_9EURO|nr:uncharacterized protein BGW36DRAFT_358965 [Talaromyces proteolyticus]KAH8697160.1 hypothetical protein BGW36DRAFT_358965 [Talaromyces proteolyticus]
MRLSKMPSRGTFDYGLLLSCFAMATLTHAALPYTPSYLFPARQSNGSLAYVLRPKLDRTSLQLLSVNLSTVDSDSPNSTVLYDNVPFVIDDGAFLPLLDSEGIINVIYGTCQASQSTPIVWTFQPDQDSAIGNGTWSSQPVKQSSNEAGKTTDTSVGYLASGFTFPALNDTLAEFYTFGGMCLSTESTSSDWVSAANYSQSMMLLSPDNSSHPASYDIEEITASSPPVAEAGFTITSLQQTSYRTSSGRLIQEGGFLFIGGHTQTAFINMSTLALFSLPQAGWTYIPVNPGGDSTRTDLAIRDTEVEPRSGHTAVISSDGSKIVVFGGWVGNTNTPANPQLAILEVGQDYGGSGEWSWSVPQPTGTALSEGSGIFGHAATMLAGDVMMISGGYTIAASGATSKRATSSFEANTQVHLFNLTSNSWETTYTMPDSQNTGPSHGSTGALSSSGEKAGLGVGVSVAAIAVLGIAYGVWTKKRWSHRRDRDKELRKLALGAERSNIWGEGGLESSYRNPGDTVIRNSILDNLYYPGPNHQYSAVPGPQSAAPEAERTGLLYEVPSPDRGLRRSLTGRPQRVQSAGWYDEVRTSYAAGSIHPIDESEEYETSPPEASEREATSQTPKAELSDPFADPSSPTRVPLIAFPENSLGRQQASDGASVRSEGARSTSPAKSERTHSTLSESSISGISDSSSIQRSHIGSIRRTINLLSSPIPALEPSHGNSPASGRSSPEKPPSRSERLESDNVRWPFDPSATVDSFSTSDSRRKHTQMEGETLLGSGPEWSTPPESPTRQPPTESKRNSLTWMGSLRKTMSNAKKAATGSMYSSSPDNSVLDPAPSPEPGPSSIPRRGSSASVAHLQRRQGPRDWAVDGRVSRSSFMSLPPGDQHTDDDDPFGDEDDWDVEAAAEGRLVQVTYTVPKEKLRVVNAGVADRVAADNESDHELKASVRE